MSKLMSVATVIWRLFYRLHSATVLGLFSFVNFFITKHIVPKVDDELLLCSALSLAKKIRSGKVKSEQVVQSCIKRCVDVNSVINAVVEDNFERALDEARRIDSLIATGAEPSVEQAPFLGVPICIKDHFFVYGMLCTAGIPKRRNVRMFEDADVVALLKSSGAIVLCTTNTSEVCMWYESNNTIYGRTCSPYDSRRTSGGSSGGQGALVGAAALPYAVGSDIAGSIRIPAYFNGIFGHKTSKDIVSQQGIHPKAKGLQMDMYSVGPMCRYAEDLLPMLKVMAGPNLKLLSLDKEVDLSKLQIFYMTDIRTVTASPVDCELKECIHKIVKYFDEKHGVMSYKVDLEYMHWALAIWLNSMEAPGAPPFSQEMCNLEGDLSPAFELFKWLFRLSEHTYPAISLALVESFMKKLGSKEDRREVAHMGQMLSRQLAGLLSHNTKLPVNDCTEKAAYNNIKANDTTSLVDCDHEAVFLFPPQSTLPPYHAQLCFTPFNFQYTAIFNVLGLPVTCCPMGRFSRQGTPLAVQVVGGPRKDHVTIAVARELERAFGGWLEP